MKKQFQNLMFTIILIAASTTVHGQNWLTAGNAPANDLSKLGTTNSHYFTVIANNAPLMWLSPVLTGRVGIGPSLNQSSSKLLVQGGVTAIQGDGAYYIEANSSNQYAGVSGNGLSNVNTSGSAYGVLGRGAGAKSNYGGWFQASGAPNGPTGITAYGIYANLLNPAPSDWAGYFNGNTFCTGLYQGSDRKLKNDINPLVNALDKIMSLKPSTYTFKTEEYKAMNLPHGKQMGLIAQDLETVFPELVTEVAEMKETNEKGDVTVIHPSFKAVNYIGLIPVLIAGMQEQQKQLNDQKSEFQSLNEQQQQEINELKNTVAQLQVTIGNTGEGGLKIGTTAINPSLGQNIPNPFNNATIIPFNIPANCQDAEIQIVEIATGRVVKINHVSCNQSQLSIEAGTLSNGGYSYTLIVNGKAIDTKQMTLTK